MKKRLLSSLAVIVAVFTLCGCDRVMDACEELLDGVGDFYADMGDNDNYDDDYHRYEESTEGTITEESVSIDTGRDYSDDDEYEPFPEREFPLHYDGDYFSISPGDKWVCYDSTEYDCGYILAEPQNIEQAALVVSVRAGENCGSDYIPLNKLVEGMDEIYEEMGYKVLEYGDTTYQGNEAYFSIIASPYNNHLITLSFQTSEHFYSFNVAYATNPISEEIKNLAEEVLSTFTVK